jgi:anti-sigma B factor antagonist
MPLQSEAIQNTLRHGAHRMNYSIVAKDGTTFITIDGTLDAVSVSDLRGELDQLVESRPKAVDVDLSQLRMIDSSGVGALVSLFKRVRAKGGDVVIRGVRDQPLAIFQLLQLDRLMLRVEKKPPRASR